VVHRLKNIQTFGLAKKHFCVCLLRIGHKSFKLTWSLIFRVAEEQMPLKVSKFDVQPSGFM